MGCCFGRNQTGDGRQSDILGHTIRCQQRSVGTATNTDCIWITSNYRVASRGAEKFGLLDSEIKKAEMWWQREVDANRKKKTNNVPDLAYRRNRSKPLLLLHLLDLIPPNSGPKPPVPREEVIAWGISFPVSDADDPTVEYVVTTTWMREAYANDIDEDDMESSMRNDPWAQISKPVEARYTGRRADADHPYDFFWARDLEGRCLLVFEYSNTIRIRDRRPRLREIRIIEPRIDGEPARFILELTHSENREIFHQLCLDIIESTRACANQKSALATLIRRTWRWHGMLKGGQDERLSPEAQKGLIGELRVLELALVTAI